MRNIFRNILRCMPAVLLLAAGSAFADDPAPAPKLDSGDTSWMLTSSLLVLMMTVPGLALFYGGLVKRNNVLATLMQSVAICCIVSVLWPMVGYALAFGEGTGFVGSLSKVMLDDMKSTTLSSYAPTIPESVFCMFQLTFAVITTALLFGSVANRIKFSAVVLIAPLWLLLVYAPVAHWVWGSGGFIGGLNIKDYAGLGGYGAALDFAGGTVVHVNSGVAGLVAAIVIGKSSDTEESTTTNLVMSVIGVGLLWVGWFGFNAGSAVSSGTGAGMAMLVTNTAAAMAAITWMFVEWSVKGKPSVAGIISGIVAGLVAITPASGFVGFEGSLVIGIAAGVICFWATNTLKKRLKYDDALDAFGIHGIGGALGAILTGVFASKAVNPAGSGLLDGNSNQIVAQIISVVVVGAYSAVMTFIILKVVNAITGLRVSREVEKSGLDLALHGEKLHG